VKQYLNPHRRGKRTRKTGGRRDSIKLQRSEEALQHRTKKVRKVPPRKPAKPDRPSGFVPRRKSKRRTPEDYKQDLKLLRRYFTGFDAAHGFSEKNLNEGAKRVIRRFTPQIKQLKSIQSYPHLELKGKTTKEKAALDSIAPIRGQQVGYKAKTSKGKIITVTPKPKQVPVFTTDQQAKIEVNKDGSTRITEHGHVRDVYPIDRVAFAVDPYKYMREFMRTHRAPRVTLNVSGNVIGEVFQESDFVDERERRDRERRGEMVRPVVGLFVTIVEKYKEKDTARADSFIANIGAISVLRGGVKDSNAFRRDTYEGRQALKEARKKQTKRGRATGRR
jgi:hypothetical protein